MIKLISNIFEEMIAVNSGDYRRIEHTIKVHNYARQIGVMENISSDNLAILEITALLHDIGIQESILKYGNCSGKNQEREGAIIARSILEKYNLKSSLIDRVCFIIGNHHTYSAIDDTVFQIIVEADFLVNATEDQLSKDQISSISKKIFKTESGIRVINRVNI